MNDLKFVMPPENKKLPNYSLESMKKGEVIELTTEDDKDYIIESYGEKYFDGTKGIFLRISIKGVGNKLIMIHPTSNMNISINEPLKIKGFQTVQTRNGTKLDLNDKGENVVVDIISDSPVKEITKSAVPEVPTDAIKEAGIDKDRLDSALGQ